MRVCCNLKIRYLGFLTRNEKNTPQFIGSLAVVFSFSQYYRWLIQCVGKPPPDRERSSWAETVLTDENRALMAIVPLPAGGPEFQQTL